jgi:predicted nucleic acid-binding protein
MFPTKIGSTIYEQAVLLDSGPLISLYDKKDIRQNEIRELLTTVASINIPIYITYLVIAETHRRLLQVVGNKESNKFLEDIFDNGINFAQIEMQDMLKAKEIIKKYHDQKITFTDATSMAIMIRLGILKVMTFDFHFGLLNFTIIPS